MNILQDILAAAQAAVHQAPANQQGKGFIPYRDPQEASQTIAPNQRVPAPNPTKIPYKNGFYAGAYDPNHQDPQNQPSLLRVMLSQVGNLGAPQSLPQGGDYNPGLTPLQSSYPTLPTRPGAASPQFQPYAAGEGIQAARHFNPQLSDTGYYYTN